MSQQPEQILNQPVANDDLADELKQSKRSMGKLTVGLAAAVLVVGAFFGGVATHAAVADEPAPAAQGPGGGRVPGGLPGGVPGGQGGQGGQPGAARAGAVGTIDRIEGSDIYVKTVDGRTVKVSTSDSTQVRITQDGSLADLKPGEGVAVQGSTGSDGTVTAQTITQQPARGQ